MILPKSSDVYHWLQLSRLLRAVLDDRILSLNMYFKGGTCASMLGWLDRFSLDLDFDINPKANTLQTKSRLEKVFHEAGLEIRKQTGESLFYLLIYSSKPDQRNCMKFSALKNQFQSNTYQSQYIKEIDRYAICQTRETMTANKLVAIMDRHDKYNTIAGRDLYDIHFFLSRNYGLDGNIIKERTGLDAKKYLEKLALFIHDRINQRIVDEDLNFLLTPEKFRHIRKNLIPETLQLVNHLISIL